MDFITMAFLVIGTSTLLRYIYLETKIASHIADYHSTFLSLEKKINFYVDQLNIMKTDMSRRFKEQDPANPPCCDPCKDEESKK